MILRDRFLHLPKGRFDWVRPALTILFDESKIGKGRYIFDYLESDSHFLAPREMNIRFKPGEVISNISRKPKLPHLETKFSLRFNQLVPATILRRRKSGILNGAPGLGKTVMGLYAAIMAREPFIVSCPNLGILGQWHEAINDLTNVTKVCQMHSKARKRGNTPWHEAEVLLSTPKTLSNIRWSMPKEFYSRWGTILYDECHHNPARTFRHSLYLFDGVRLGLTATLERRDGMEIILSRHVGPVLYKNLTLPIEPEIEVVTAQAQIPEDYPYDINIYLYRALTDAPGWLKAVTNEINERLALRRRILVITHIKAHAERLSEIYPGSGLITQDTPFALRHVLLKTKDVTFGTFNSAREALDGPELDTLIFTTPFHVWSAFFQGLGRVARDVEDKPTPVVVIMEPEDVYMAKSMIDKLLANIREEGYAYKRKTAGALQKLRRLYEMRPVSLPKSDRVRKKR